MIPMISYDDFAKLEIKIGNRIFRYEMYPWIKA